MSNTDQIRIDTAVLTKFLKTAKLNTFASGNKPRISAGMKRYRYQEDPLFYEDQYTGSLIDVGVEVVRFGDIPIWGMSYRGGIIPGKADQQLTPNVFAFLKDALKNMPPQMPIRGPHFFVADALCYQNNIEGDLNNFAGQETIFMDKKPIYTRTYHGGIVLGKTITVSLFTNKEV